MRENSSFMVDTNELEDAQVIKRWSKEVMCNGEINASNSEPQWESNIITGYSSELLDKLIARCSVDCEPNPRVF